MIPITENPLEAQPLASLLTAAGRGAIATVRVHVDVRHWPVAQSAPFRAVNGLPLASQPIGRIVFGRWGHDPAEDVVVCRLDAATLEIHCHGGDAAAGRILRDLEAAGCKIVPWWELARRTQGTIEAEILEALSQATTLRTAAILVEQSDGLLRRALDALLAGEINAGPLARWIEQTLRWADFALHLTQPWHVAVTGRPNVGKSSLINALLGYARSIVFEQPGTTRDVVTARAAVDGWPIELSDTAGIRESNDPLESAGIEQARENLARADLPVLLIDVGHGPHEDDHQLLSAFPNAIIVAHKCDLPHDDGAGAWPAGVARRWIRVSSKTLEGLDHLITAISRRLVPEVPPAATPLPVTPRQVAALRKAGAAARRGDVALCRGELAALLR